MNQSRVFPVDIQTRQGEQIQHMLRVMLAGEQKLREREREKEAGVRRRH